MSSSGNLYAILGARFGTRLDRPCMRLADGRELTYRWLDESSARMARALLATGAQRGDRVAVQVEKSPEALALYLGAVRAGLVFLPLNTGYQRNELAYFFGDAEPRVIVGTPAAREALTAIAPTGSRVLSLGESGDGTLAEAARGQVATFDTADSAPDDLAAILYTSGTTGRSKGAMLTHRNLASNALALVDYWGFTDEDVLLHALPIYHVHGLFVATHCVLLSASRMIFLPRFDVRQAMALLPTCTAMMGVPTYYTRLLKEPDFGAEVCRSMRLFVSGSAPLLAETFAEFRQRTGMAILERYGMTETGMNTSNPLVGERLAGTVGLPLPGVEVRVVDDAGVELAPGQLGHIQVRGDNVFAGYWRMPEKTREEFAPDGFFRTGDMGEILANGYLRIVGRAKDLVISGGLNVYPKEIEEAIDAMPGVVESAVIGLPHPDFGEAVAAVIVARPGAALDEEAVIGQLRGNLATFKVPKRVFFLDDLPRNAMGKVQKNVLRERYKATFG